MNSTQKTSAITSESLQKAAKVAGLMYLVIIVLSILNFIFIESSLFVAGNDSATVNNIMENDFLFRIGVVSDIIMFVLVVILAVALYVILKQVNRNLALTALFLRFGEGIIGGAILLLSGLIPLLLSKGEAVFEAGQFQALFVSFLDIRNAGMDIVIIFMGIGAIIFFYLFFKSGFIPKAISIWGMLTYLLMLILSFANILFPDRSEMIEIIHYGPGTLFEFIFGLFLLIRGIKVQ